MLIDGAPALTVGDQGVVAGCAFTVPTGKPQPCVKILLTMAASKVLIGGKPALLVNPADIAQSAEQIPGGPVVWTAPQTKVTAT